MAEKFGIDQLIALYEVRLGRRLQEAERAALREAFLKVVIPLINTPESWRVDMPDATPKSSSGLMAVRSLLDVFRAFSEVRSGATLLTCFCKLKARGSRHTSGSPASIRRRSGDCKPRKGKAPARRRRVHRVAGQALQMAMMTATLSCAGHSRI
jgi:hypothetical protein